MKKIIVLFGLTLSLIGYAAEQPERPGGAQYPGLRAWWEWSKSLPSTAYSAAAQLLSQSAKGVEDLDYEGFVARSGAKTLIFANTTKYTLNIDVQYSDKKGLEGNVTIDIGRYAGVKFAGYINAIPEKNYIQIERIKNIKIEVPGAKKDMSLLEDEIRLVDELNDLIPQMISMSKGSSSIEGFRVRFFEAGKGEGRRITLGLDPLFKMAPKQR